MNIMKEVKPSNKGKEVKESNQEGQHNTIIVIDRLYVLQKLKL